MAREIVIKRGDYAIIRRNLKCTDPTIRRALRGAEDTLLAFKIRAMARSLGGKYTVKIDEEVEK
jgi:hypothetical protein